MKAKYIVDENNKTVTLESNTDGFEVLFKGFDTIQPVFDYLLVEKDEEVSKTESGLVIPDSVKEKPSSGTVVAVGGGAFSDKTGEFMPMVVKVGDRVLFPKHAGQTVKVNDEEKYLIKQSAILGILK